MEEKILLTVNEAAIRLSLGKSKLYELIARGEIPVVRIGRATRINALTLQKWAEQLASMESAGGAE